MERYLLIKGYANLKAMTRQYFYLTQVNISCKNRYKRLIMKKLLKDNIVE